MQKRAKSTKDETPFIPMAVAAPTDAERLVALEIQFKIMKDMFNKLYREHHMVNAL